MRTFLYVIDSKSYIDEGIKHVKIGSSNNPVNRRKTLQTSVVRCLKIVRVFEILNYSAYAIDDFLKTINSCKQYCKGINITNYRPDLEGGCEHYIVPNIDDLEKLFHILDIKYELITDLSIFDKNDKHNESEHDNSRIIKELTEKLKNKDMIKHEKTEKIIWQLEEHQQDTINVFKNDYLQGKLKSGIVSHPTGTGKTITAIAMCGCYWSIFPSQSILWITERKDIMKSQFQDSTKLDICTNSGFIQNEKFYNKQLLFGKKIDIVSINKMLINDKPMFLVINTDNIMTNEKYKLLSKNKFGLVIIDECHSVGAKDTYDMLKYFQTEWNSFMVGFSATPLRLEDQKYKRIVNILGNENKANFISLMTMIDAIDKKIIVPPEFIWVETTINEDVSYKQFIQQMDDSEYTKIVQYIEKVLTMSITKKSLAWAQTIDNANEWRKILLLCQKNRKKYPILAEFKIFITHTKLKNSCICNDEELYEQLDDFMICKDPCLLICVGRCIEGYDDQMVDVCIDLDAAYKRGLVVSIQKIGRALRKYQNKPRGIMMETFSFDDETTKYSQICNMFIGYAIFLRQSDASGYKEIVESVSINKERKEIIMTTPCGNQIKFKIVTTTMKNIEWTDIEKNIPIQLAKALHRDGISYNTAKTIIKSYNLLSKEKYYEICNTDLRLPNDPENTFGDKFIDWIDYLGIERKYYNLEECKKNVQQYINNTNISKTYDYTKLCYQISENNNMFPPASLWVEYYKRDGIKTINDIISIQNRQKKSLNELLK